MKNSDIRCVSRSSRLDRAPPLWPRHARRHVRSSRRSTREPAMETPHPLPLAPASAKQSPPVSMPYTLSLRPPFSPMRAATPILASRGGFRAAVRRHACRDARRQRGLSAIGGTLIAYTSAAAHGCIGRAVEMAGLDPGRVNADIVADLHEAGRIAPLLTEFDGRVVIRAAIVNH